MLGMDFNPAGLTFEELVQKQTDLRKKYGMAMSAGANAQVLGQIQNVLDDITFHMGEIQILEREKLLSGMKKDDFGDSLSIG
jgi:hypothetical protein